MARQLRGRHASLIACSLLLLVAPSIPGCEEDIGDGLLCCETSAFRGCCWDEPLAAGGSDSPDSNLCGGPTRLPIPACGEFPVSSGIDTRGCEILFEDTSAEPCECTPPEDGCEPICVVPEPPSLPDACAGVTSVSENPSSCPATGNVVTYAVTKIAAVPDSASGFDLDGTAESSCVEGALTVPDAPRWRRQLARVGRFVPSEQRVVQPSMQGCRHHFVPGGCKCRGGLCDGHGARLRRRG